MAAAELVWAHQVPPAGGEEEEEEEEEGEEGGLPSAELWCIPWSHPGLFSQQVPTGEDFPLLKAVRKALVQQV